jgi:glutathione S-transferase
MWNNLRPVFWNLVRTAPDKRNMIEVEDSRKKLAVNLAIVDALLDQRRYIAGESFTMADIPMGVAAYRWFNLPIDRPAMPQFERWYGALCERPSFQKNCMLPLT